MNNKNINNSNPLNVNIKYSILMVGIALPQQLMNELAAQDKYPGGQGHTLQWGIIRGVESAAGQSMNLLSIASIGDYPRHPIKLMHGGRWQHQPGVDDKWLPFINIMPLKQITRFLVMLCGILRWLWQHRKVKKRIVLLYPAQSPQFCALLLATIFYPAYKFAVIADPISADLKGEGWIRKTARRIERRIQYNALKRVEGLVVLADSLAKDYAPGKPYLVVEGIAPAIAEIRSEQQDESAPFGVLYAGMLNVSNGVQLLLDSVPFLPNGIEIWIYGRGRLEQEVIKRANEDSRIKYFGFRPYNEMILSAQKAISLITPRLSVGMHTKYNFPSKLLEYLMIGKPVISTRFPTIPPDYEPYIVWIEEETPQGLAQAICKVKSMTPDMRTTFGQKGRDFVRAHKSEGPQGKRIWDFVSQVAGIKE